MNVVLQNKKILIEKSEIFIGANGFSHLQYILFGV